MNQWVVRILPTVLGVWALALNPLVSAETVGATICRAGWAQGQRPPTAYVARLERVALAGAGAADRRAYVMDHAMPISLGGAPMGAGNLRPQLAAEAKVKDRLERSLHRAVCAGEIALPAAQRVMAEAWP